MKLTYIVIFAVIVSVVALSISVWVLMNTLSEDRLPSGVQQVEVMKSEYEEVTFDSSVYNIGLGLFEGFGDRARLRIESSSAYTFRYINLGETILAYDLKITFKETRSNSVVLWIEQIED